MNTNKIVENLKSANMDYEFYPTTQEIINVIKRNIGSYGQILDIGAGNGATLDKLVAGNADSRNSWTKYAIEKNPMLRALISNDTLIIGNDFFENSLWDKELSVIFCNPPYSEYIEWMYKIIAEANADKIFFVVPGRWDAVEKLQAIIERRGFIIESLGKYDFLNAERAARCNVDVIMLTHSNRRKQDFFDIELEKFLGNENKTNATENYNEAYFKKGVEAKKLVCAGDYVQAITSMYHDEQQRIFATLKAIGEIDTDLLGELSIDLSKIKALIMYKLKSLNNSYWNQIIEKLHAIANRLIAKHKQALLSRINKTGISFNAGNIYNVVEWAIKTASQLLEQQILDVYNDLISEANCTKYKSNHKIFVGNNFETKTPSKLNYRIVVTKYYGICKPGSWSTYDYPQNLHRNIHSFLADLCIIAKSLGYEIESNSSLNMAWHSGESQDFNAVRNGKTVVLMTAKAYYNGNVHIKLNKDFNHKLNVIKGKFEGWIHSADEVAEEFNVNKQEAAQLFEDLPKLGVNIAGLLN